MEIPAAKFKQRCLELMDQVADLKEEIVITKRGKPVARLVPFERPAEIERPFFGFMAGKGEIIGDLESSMEVEWDAEQGCCSRRMG